MTIEEKLIENVIKIFLDRSGFDEWWHKIGEKNREEIRRKLAIQFHSTICLIKDDIIK